MGSRIGLIGIETLSYLKVLVYESWQQAIRPPDRSGDKECSNGSNQNVVYSTWWKRCMRLMASSKRWSESFVRGSSWFHGKTPFRSFLGPYPGALISLNLLAALFGHSHSDASMRILHGYTSIGLLSGVFSCITGVRLQWSAHHPWRVTMLSLWTLLNLTIALVNTWIAFKGMGIPYGNIFHLLLAGILTANVQLAQVIYQKEITVTSLTGDAIWQAK